MVSVAGKSEAGGLASMSSQRLICVLSRLISISDLIPVHLQRDFYRRNDLSVCF